MDVWELIYKYSLGHVWLIVERANAPDGRRASRPVRGAS